MIGVIVTLAVLAIAAAGAATAVALRLAGVRDELKRAELEAAAAVQLAHDQELAARGAFEEARQMRARLGRLDEQRRAELDELQAAALRCADPAELRQMLRRLTIAEPRR